MSEVNYVLKVTSWGDCAGTVQVLFADKRPYITKVEAEYGTLDCYLTLERTKDSP